MSEKEPPKINWLDHPDGHDFPAAQSYLSLFLAPKRVARIVAALRKAPPTTFKAKDVLRASQLTLLDVDNQHVKKDRMKIEEGTAISPILLVRDRRNRRVIVADGFHRLCAVYELDEDASIPCRIV